MIYVSAMFLCVPQLCRLSIDYISWPVSWRISNPSFVLNNLTAVSLTLHGKIFDDVEQFIRSYLRQVQTFYLSTIAMFCNLETKRWEYLFLLDITHLQKFKLQIKWFHCTSHVHAHHDLILNELNSSLSSQCQWFFTQEYELTCDKRYYVLIYSTITGKSTLNNHTNQRDRREMFYENRKWIHISYKQTILNREKTL